VTAVTLVRLAAPRAGTATYIALRTELALDFLARGADTFAAVAPDHDLDPADVDLDTVPWETLPGVRRLAARALESGPVLVVGTVVDGCWTSWYPPCPMPAAPPGPRP
jgi:hypothetical protein